MTNDYCPPVDLEVLREYCWTAGFYMFVLLLWTWQVIVKIVVFFTIWHMNRTEYIHICFTHLKRRGNYVCIFPIFCYYSSFHGKKKCACVYHVIIAQALQNTASCPKCIISIFCIYRHLRTPGSNLGFFQGFFEGLLIVRNSGNKHKYFEKV